MHVRCPHCHNPIELVDDSALHDVECPSCGSHFSLVDNRTTAPYQATKILGHFELTEQLGMGAFGTVWKALDTQLDRTVAIKIPRKDQLNAKEAESFLREARAAAQLKHPSIVSVHEVGKQDDQLYIVSDFVQGATLADWIEGQTLTAREAAELTAKIADALQHAHDAGVVHRDLKPANIMMDLDSVPHIMDFGLAKREAGEITMTVEGKVLGTPAYMPPEQARGEGHHADARSDLYSLGVILFQLLTGELPFRGNPRMLIVQILREEPPSLRKLNSTVPRDLETISLKCLQKEPSKRYDSARALSDDLQRANRGEPIHARPIGRIERAVRWCRRKPITASLLLSLIVLAVGGVTLSSLLVLTSRQSAISKVDALLHASPAAIPIILQDLDQQSGIVQSRLKELDSQELLSPQRLRLSLALLPSDPSQLDNLKAQLYECTFEELAIVLECAKSEGGIAIVSDLWKKFHGVGQDEARFRAGIALAALDNESEQWTDGDYEFLVQSMLAENTVYQPAIRRSLSPMAAKLVSDVKSAYENAEQGTLADESSANAIVDFAANDSELLSELSIISTPKQYAVVFPVVEREAASDESIVQKFADIAREQHKPDDDEPTRIKLGKGRAGAAVNLLRLGKPDDALEVLRVNEDPESMTQFVHGCKSRGVTVEQLLDLLNRTSSVSEVYGLLLTLGEFELTDIVEDIRPSWVDYVKRLYANDRRSGIHGVSGWLLRRWGLSLEAKAIEEREVPYSRDREWFTLKINLAVPPQPEQNSYFTFVVISAGEYKIGSPEHEANRVSSVEQRRKVTITRSFAILDREVTREEFNAVTGFRGYSNDQEWQRFSAMSGTTWYESVHFCRELTIRRAFGEEMQAYSNPTDYDREHYSSSAGVLNPPKNWPLDLSKEGFRLPTAAEWEIACRGNTVSRYGFGCDVDHLDRYGWYEDSSNNRGHRPRLLRPNTRGLHNMHGNMFEWCHDWSEENTVDVLTDPKGKEEGLFRVLRGGGWGGNRTHCRSAARNDSRPTISTPLSGFRVVFSPG